MTDQEKLDSTLDRAYELLDEGLPEEARDLGLKAISMGHESGYEVVAFAERDLGNPSKAVEVLEQGVHQLPASWRLWQLLGNFLSDADRYPDAQRCYLRALNCPEVDQSSVRHNLSIALGRQGRHEDALRELPSATNKELAPWVLAQEFFLLNRVGRYQEVIHKSCGERTNVLLRDHCVPNDAKAEIMANIAEAHWEGPGDSGRALTYAREALSFSRSQSKALRLIREMAGAKSETGRSFRIVVEVPFEEDEDAIAETRSYYTSFGVVADSPEEALQYIIEIAGSGARLHDTFEQPTSFGDLKGVYGASARFSTSPPPDTVKRPRVP